MNLLNNDLLEIIFNYYPNDLIKLSKIHLISKKCNHLLITYINFAYHHNLQTLDILIKYTNLIELCLDDLYITDYTPIKHLTNIEILRMRSTKIQDLSFLTKYKKLYYIDFSHSMVNNLIPLSYCLKLEYLNLLGCMLLSYNALDNLNKLKNLQVLEIGFSSIGNISILKYLPNLIFLSLRNSRVINFNSLIYCNKLEVLDICFCKIRDYNFLSQIPNLKSLWINNCKYDFIKNICNNNVIIHHSN